MKAFVVGHYRKKDGMRMGEMPEPVLREHDVLVEIHAGGLNPLDSKIGTGKFKLFLPYKVPFVLCNAPALLLLIDRL